MTDTFGFARAFSIFVRALLAAAWVTLFLGQAPAQVTEGDDGPLRYGRFEHKGEVFYGFLSVGGIHQLDRSFLDPKARRTGLVFPLDTIRILSPIVPKKVIAVALNYKSHGGQRTRELPFFAKLPSAIIATGEQIVPPPGSTSLHYEGEMVIVIGKKGRDISRKNAKDFIFGVTIGNDVTERGYGFSPFDLLRTKGSDTLSPLGPWIVPGLHYDRLRLETRLNGKVVQKSSTSKMIFSVSEIVSRISRYITMEPGDVIYTGTPGTTGPMRPGDRIEVRLEGVGKLENTVKGP